MSHPEPPDEPDPRDAVVPSQYDIFAEDFPQRREEILDGLREHEPVRWHPPGTNPRHDRGFWTVARYDDVLAVKRNPQVFSNFETTSYGLVPGTFAYEVGSRRLSCNDGEYHDVVRKLCGRSMRPSVLKSYLDTLTRKAGEGLDAFEARLRDGDTVDWVRDFAYMFPVFAVGLLLGLPEDLMDDLAARYAAGTPASDDELEEAFRQVVRDRLAHPADDMTTTLVQAAAEGSPFLELDTVHFNLVAFYLAGHLTTTHLMAWVLVELQRHPELRRSLADDHDLIPGFVEETLRVDPPVVATFNTVLEDTVLDGHELQAMEHVFTVYAAANRDPSVFADPARFDITRTPNPHLAFSHGTHFCLGAPLARLETRLVLEDLLHRDLAVHVDLAGAVRAQNTFSSLPVSLAS